MLVRHVAGLEDGRADELRARQGHEAVGRKHSEQERMPSPVFDVSHWTKLGMSYCPMTVKCDGAP